MMLDVKGNHMRKKRRVKLVIGLLIILFSFGCDESESDKKIYLNEDDNGRYIEATTDSSIVIKLPANPSTGYRWVYSNADGNNFFQEGDSTFHVLPECSNGMDGCPGHEEMIFKTTKSCASIILLIYTREGENNTPNEQEFTITITVK